MADLTLLNDPIAAAAIATWAATAGQPDALARGDAAAALLGSIWPAANVATYQASTPEQRLAVWASGDGLKWTNSNPTPEKVKAVQELYAELYSPPKNPGVVPSGFLESNAIVLALLATMAAQQKADDALTRGDAAAKALSEQGKWNLIQSALYGVKSPADKVLYWASGEALADFAPDSTLIEAAKKLYLQEYAKQIQEGKLEAPVSMPVETKPEKAAESGGGGFIKIAGAGAAIWLALKIFGK